jgi:hypothetical protein
MIAVIEARRHPRVQRVRPLRTLQHDWCGKRIETAVFKVLDESGDVVIVGGSSR